MLPRCFVVCALILAPSLAVAAPTPPDLLHLGRNIVVTPEERFGQAGCFFCSVDVEGRGNGSVRVVAGNVFLNGAVGGNVLVVGGNVMLTSRATVGGRVRECRKIDIAPGLRQGGPRDGPRQGRWSLAAS